MTQKTHRSCPALALACAVSLVVLAACGGGGDSAAPDVSVTIDAKVGSLVTSSSISPAPEATTTLPAPVTTATRPRPATTVAAPSLSSVHVASPAPGQTCVLGTSTTTVLVWNSQHAAGVQIYSTTYGNLGQFPAETGSAEVPFECDGGSTIFSLTPVAEGGATGARVDLEVPSYMT